ncbi:MAG TPA: Grx4 family monothiol glutaredoxin [Kofleriaceae bacterium]|nr:Grx4 family monothiol glutaredoxin [Kofleriaceae bacterium]
MALTPELRAKIETLIKSDDVVLFMKGTKSFPQCGFSASVVNILNTLIPKYTTVNVLSDPDVRQGIKEYSDWPTIPQLYVKGELVGGSDIVKSLHESGELAGKLGAKLEPLTAPKITVTPKALEVLKGALGDADPGSVIHVSVDGSWEHGLDIGPPEKTSASFEQGGVAFQIDRGSAGRAAGLVIDFVEGPGGGGFKMDNPNRPPSVREVSAKELSQLLASGAVKELFDVRSPAERERAKIEGSRLFDDAAIAYLEGLSKDTPIAFHCHHGGRSRNAAAHFLGKGFKTVYNLAGGIDAWSKDVDPKVPKY